MKNLREVSIKILSMFEPVEPGQHTESQIASIESVLEEVVEEAQKEVINHMAVIEDMRREEARSSALEEAAMIVEKEHKFCEPPMCEIANKIRALMGGG